MDDDNGSKRTAEVEIRIESEDDLYNRFDPSRRKLSDDVLKYIMECMPSYRIGGSHRLVIRSASPVDEDRVRSVFAENLDVAIADTKVEKRHNTLNQLRLFIIGIAFISIWLVASTYLDGLWPEVLSIIGSFSVWEAANIWIKENPGVKARRIVLESLKESDIVFAYDG